MAITETFDNSLSEIPIFNLKKSLMIGIVSVLLIAEITLFFLQPEKINFIPAVISSGILLLLIVTFQMLKKLKHNYSLPILYFGVICVSITYYSLNLNYNPVIILYFLLIGISIITRKPSVYKHISFFSIISFAAVLIAGHLFKRDYYSLQQIFLSSVILLSYVIIFTKILHDHRKNEKKLSILYQENHLLKMRLRNLNVSLAQELKKVNYKLSATFIDIIKSLAQILETRDIYTRGHSERVTYYALHLANALNLNQEKLDLIREGGLFHDIGKVGIPDKVLQKPGKLDDDEFSVMKTHVVIGKSILSSIEGLNDTIVKICSSHHERVDGKGYPDGLTGDIMPVEVRIMAIADAFDAMTSNRVYRPGMPIEQAISQLETYSDFQFDKDLASTFIKLIREGIIQIPQ